MKRMKLKTIFFKEDKMEDVKDTGDFVNPDADDPTDPEVTDKNDPNYVEPARDAVSPYVKGWEVEDSD